MPSPAPRSSSDARLHTPLIQFTMRFPLSVLWQRVTPPQMQGYAAASLARLRLSFRGHNCDPKRDAACSQNFSANGRSFHRAGRKTAIADSLFADFVDPHHAYQPLRGKPPGRGTRIRCLAWGMSSPHPVERPSARMWRRLPTRKRAGCLSCTIPIYPAAPSVKGSFSPTPLEGAKAGPHRSGPGRLGS
jgi:hypothetical protein